MAASSGEMPFLDHLEELRSRILKVLVAVIVGFGAGLWIVQRFQFEPGKEYPDDSSVQFWLNGAGKIRGIYLQNNDMVRPIFTAWLAPFRDLGVTTVTLDLSEAIGAVQRMKETGAKALTPNPAYDASRPLFNTRDEWLKQEREQKKAKK